MNFDDRDPMDEINRVLNGIINEAIKQEMEYKKRLQYQALKNLIKEPLAVVKGKKYYYGYNEATLKECQ